MEAFRSTVRHASLTETQRGRCRKMGYVLYGLSARARAFLVQEDLRECMRAEGPSMSQVDGG